MKKEHSASDRFQGLAPQDLNSTEQESLVALALAVLAHRHQRGQSMSCSADTRAFLRVWLGERRTETFGSLYLDSQHRILECQELFHGTIDGAAVYPRVLVQDALRLNAAAVVLFHNHPSGIAEPSRSDEAITKRLKEALALVDVRVLDHVVVAAGESVSFAERGLL